MKHILCILLLLTIGFTACQRNTPYPLAMQQAEELMNTRPDSALHLLEGMADTLSMLPEEARMYYHLLTIQAKDKQYITHTDDSLINRIVSYYEESGDNDRLMMAYYYQGSTYRDMNDAPRALKAFHQAIDAGKDTKNLTLLGQTYGQMGALLAKHELYDEALEVHKECLSLYQRTNEKQRIPLVFRNIARIYNATEKNDSAIYFYEKGYKIAKDNNDEKSIYSIASELGCLYYEMGNFGKSKQFLHSSLASSRKKNNAILYLGLIYKDENQKDSARYFLNQTLICNDIKKQQVAHKCLAQLEKEDGNEAKTDFHQKHYLLLQDSILTMTKTDELKEHHQTYNYERLKKAYAKLQQESRNYCKHSKLTGILAIALTATIPFVFFYRKKQKKALPSRNHTHLSAIYKENIYQKFQKAGNNETVVSDSDWAELLKLTEKELPNFSQELSRLTKEFNLSQQELRICCLLKIGFINKEISYILRVTKSAISRSQSRMYGKLTGEKENASKMRLFIDDL